MQHDEQVIGVAVHLRHAVAFGAVVQRQRVQVEVLRQHAFGVVVPVRHVDPHQTVGARAQFG